VTDPVILICAGVICIGLVALIWAIYRFRHLSKSLPADKSASGGRVGAMPDTFGLDLGIPPLPMSAPAPSPAVSKEVADRLEGMTQRLAEMQAVLTKQSSAPSTEPGGVGQGFSPETIDKLLKIIGNVVQQVEVLQKNLNPAKESAPPKAGAAAAPPPVKP
jgi:hypothetical protein